MSKIENSKENRSDIKKIIELVTKFDHSRNNDAEKAYQYASFHSHFETEYGEKYMERVQNICARDEKSRACIICGEKYAKNRVVCEKCLNKYKGIELNPVTKFSDKIDDIAGGDGFLELKWKDLFSDIFKKHTKEEAENIFICGTATTTPERNQLSDEWPKPWLYFQVAVYMYIAFFFLALAVIIFGNIYSIPGMLFIGSMIVPFSVLIMFFELNVPRNISIFQTIIIFFVGGCASILLSLILYVFAPVQNNFGLLDALLIGLVEETGKLVVVIIFINKLFEGAKKELYLLNGMLVGAAVGAGFAVFESAGYAFSTMMPEIEEIQALGDVSFNIVGMFANMVIRGLLAPGNHIVWTAMAGFGVARVIKNEKFKLKHAFKKRFIAIFSVPVLLHALWDLDIPILSLTKLFVLVILAWIAILVFVDNGLDEINIINREDESRPEPVKEEKEETESFVTL